MDKSPDAFRTISEVADWLGVQAHVLRFWESKFTQVKPVKRAGGRRYYRPSDMLLIGGIKKLLHDDGLTIKGAQKLLREQGVAHVAAMSQSLDDVAGVVVASKDAEPTVVAFASKQAKGRAPNAADTAVESPKGATADVESKTEAPPAADPVAEEPDPAPAAAPTPPPAPEPEEMPVAETAATVAEPDPTTEEDAEQPTLPSFLHRPKEEPKRAEVVDAPDPVSDDAMPYQQGALARLSRLNRLSKDDAAAIVPLADALKAWRDRTIGTAQV